MPLISTCSFGCPVYPSVAPYTPYTLYPYNLLHPSRFGSFRAVSMYLSICIAEA
jgi:hypothetical protein